MKVAKACVQCRDAKRRCNLDDGAACIACRQRRLSCSRAATGSVRFSGDRPIAPSVEDEESLPAGSRRSAALPGIDYIERRNEPSAEVISALVELYLHYIHDRPHSLFHRATLWAEIRDGSISKGLLYSICGLGAQVSRDKAVCELSKRFEADAKAYMRENIENVTLANVQTCILLANLCAAELQTQSEVLYFGIANRMAQLLGLHKTSEEDSVVLRETKVRVWWTLVMADRWCSSGLDLPRQLMDPGRHVRMPLDEFEFQNWQPGAVTPVRTSATTATRPGLWAYMITLVEIFEPIQELNRQSFRRSHDASGLDDEARRLADLLDTWVKDLPAEIQWCEKNLDLHISRGLGGAFVALHLGFHHYSTLLFFQYLDLERIATPDGLRFAWKCRHHASWFSIVLQTSRERPDCEAVYLTVGHMTVVSSSVILYTLLFGDSQTVPEARRCLTANFAALVDLRELWPNLSRAINKLFAFQNACLHSANPNTHKIDHWMLRFLLEHGVHLGEKTSDGELDGSLHSAHHVAQDEELSNRRDMSDQVLSSLLE